MNWKYISLVSIALAALVAGCGNPVKSKVEKSVAQSLPDIIGPAQSYSAKAHGSSLRMVKGKLDQLDITGVGVKLPNGMTLSRLDVKISDLAFDTDKREITRAGSTEFTASLSEAELNKYLAKKYPAIPDLKASLREGTIGISSKPGVSVLRVSVNADADLEIRQERILALNVKKLRVAGINAPNFARGFLDDQLGTIFDVKDLGFEARLSSAAIRRGSLALGGSLDLMKMMEKRQQAQQTGANRAGR